MYYKDYFNSSVKNGEAPYTYAWSVNNGFSSSNKNINVTFYTPGIKIITLNVISNNKLSGSSVFILNVVNTSVYITSSTTNINAGGNVTFYSHINGGIKPFKYYWYINGTLINNHNKTFRHEFTKSGNYTVSLTVNNGNAFNISTSFNFNPWDFSDKFYNYSIRNSWGNGNSMINDETINSNGNLTFHFYLYNPGNKNSSDNITVYLYNNLPENGPGSTPIKNFTFHSGNIDAKTGKWVTVNNVYWNYSFIAVLPMEQTGLNGGCIGVANPGNFNYIYSHYWFNGKFWDSSDDGFIGYWTVSRDITIEVK